MPGLADLRNKALDKYDDDLNPVGGAPAEGGLEAAPAAPAPEAPLGGEAPPMEDELGATPGGGELEIMASMLSEAGIEAAPEEVEAFIDILKSKAMEMAEEPEGGPPGGLEGEAAMPPAPEGGMAAPPM